MHRFLSRCLPPGAFHVALALTSLSLFVPATSRAQDRPQMVICTVATETDDGAALDKARKYMADAKDEASPAGKQEQERAKANQPPLFPNPEKSQSVSSTQLAAAMALPQLGLGDSLLSLALLNQPAQNAVAEKEKPLLHRYRWVELKELELRILKLDAAAAAAKTDLWNKVDKARKAGEPYVLDKPYQWIICSRATDAGIVFYLLLREPSPACTLTEDQLENVRLTLDTDGFRLTMYFNDPAGKERLKDFSTANKPPKDGRRFLTVVVRNRAVVIVELKNIQDQGRLEVRGKFRESEINDMAKTLQALAPSGQSGP